MPPPNPSKQPASPSNGRCILLAEDDPFISRMYQIKLEKAGFAVELVTNGRDAYEHFKANKPDLALIDINMPELTGLQVIKALQSDGEEKLGERIMVLTNSANPKDKQFVAQFGIEYMVKAEMTPRQVLEKISGRLGLKPPEQDGGSATVVDWI